MKSSFCFNCQTIIALLWMVGILSLAPGIVSGQTPLIATDAPLQAPPPAPPIVVIPKSPVYHLNGFTPPEGATPYSIGNPTDEEQLYLEYLNRARTNAPAEGFRLANTTDSDVLNAYAFFGVNLSVMQSQFNAISAAPPLAFNSQLIAAARWHSGDMYTNVYQGHFQTNGTNVLDPGNRITAMGYTWYTYGENVYATAQSVFYGHAGFEVDWGPGTNGMQNPPGHRIDIHNAAFREVGVGVVDGSHTISTNTVGPQLVTQDFATQPSDTPFITGVVYYDLNGNGFYDIGEGIGGVTVQVPGSVYFAITANSGGYAVPITTNGNYLVSFSANGLASQGTHPVSGLQNIKVDYIPVYSPPVISGPNPAPLNNDSSYSFTPVAAATNYQYVIVPLAAYTSIEGAENGTNNVTVVSSAGYSVLASDVKASGSFSFHLCHPMPPVDQSITLNNSFLTRTNSRLVFAKRLGWSGTGETARAQISTNGGNSWQDVWTQTGTNGSGDTSFSRITNSLSTFAGTTIQVRFRYDVGGIYFSQTSSGVGLYLDDITVTNVDLVQNPQTNNVLPGNSIVFHPTVLGDYLISVSAQLSGRTLSSGPAIRVTAAAILPMTVQFTGAPAITGNQIRMNFNVANYQGGAPFTLQKSTSLGTGWTTDGQASFQTNVPNTQFQAITVLTDTNAFYRVRVY